MRCPISDTNSMDTAKLLAASLWHYRRSHVAVMLGVAVATAVITGALLVGDSVRGSLRDLVLERLGAIDHALVTASPFRADLAQELGQSPGFDDRFALSTPAMLLSASATHRTTGATRRASGVSLIGVTEDFGRFNTHGPDLEAAWDIPAGSVWLTQALAEELRANIGDQILLLLPTSEAIPADSPLGEKTDTTVARRWKVDRVLEPDGLARFSLSPSQRPPKNAFVSLVTAQQAIDQPGKANLLLVGGEKQQGGNADWLADQLRPSLEDYGLSLKPVASGRALQLESKELVLPDAAVKAARQAWGTQRIQPAVTYLANTLRLGDNQVPYSTITGISSTADLGPLLDAESKPIRLADDQIVLNRWAADALGAQVGDTVQVTYYEPESTHGELVEASPLSLTLQAIVELSSPDGQPTPAADPQLTPEMEGVTDARSINDWDLPFELIEKITQADEDYWDQHSTTPKAFVSLALAKQLWATRWGTTSLVRIESRNEEASANQAAGQLLAALPPGDLGFAFAPIKSEGLAAASGTTPFDGLFFGFSMFLIASAIMLITLLYRLGVEQRAREVGLLTATGWTPAQVRRMLTLEGLVVADLGAAIGVAAGVGYAWLMLTGLRTLWVAAIVTPFLELHIRWQSLLIGYLVGVVVSGATIALSTRSLALLAPRLLLTGQTSDPLAKPQAARRWRWVTVVLFALAIGLAASGATQRGEAQAGMFFTSGALVLLAIVLRVRAWLLGQEVRVAAPSSFGMTTLAARNIARNPGRSLLTIALVGAASFLILAISSFHLPPTESGTGGYALVSTADQPLHYDLNTQQGRDEYGFNDADQRMLDGWQIDALRVYDGEDASCLNLYQTAQPRVLGVPEGFTDRFDWAAKPRGKKFKGNTFLLLKDVGETRERPGGIPVILDFNTAMYSLKLYGGVGSQLTIKDSAGRPATLEVVAMLKNSMLQGDLLMSEENFLELFPESGGYRLLLAKNKKQNHEAPQLAALLEDQLTDYGLDAEPAEERLAGFLAVQNTYLSTFQSLGALGLLLGVVGVAVVQLRNIAQRRGELALLQATGFTTQQVAVLVLRENLLLLLGGLAAGGVAAAVALAPQTVSHDTHMPWLTTLTLLLVIVGVGVVVGWLATRGTLKAPLLPALRGE